MAVALILAEPVVLTSIMGLIGGFVFMWGIVTISWQRRREDDIHLLREAVQQAEFETMANEVMRAMAERFNDECEAAGQGRPLVLDRVVYH